jgi:hypothetical protein
MPLHDLAGTETTSHRTAGVYVFNHGYLSQFIQQTILSQETKCLQISSPSGVNGQECKLTLELFLPEEPPLSPQESIKTRVEMSWIRTRHSATAGVAIFTVALTENPTTPTLGSRDPALKKSLFALSNHFGQFWNTGCYEP